MHYKFPYSFFKKRTKKEIKTLFILVCFAKFTLLFSPEKMTKMKKKVKFRKLEFIFLLFKAFYLKAKRNSQTKREYLKKHSTFRLT